MSYVIPIALHGATFYSIAFHSIPSQMERTHMQLAGSLLRSFEVKLLLFFCSTPGRHKTRDVTLDLADVVAFNDYPGAVEELLANKQGKQTTKRSLVAEHKHASGLWDQTKNLYEKLCWKQVHTASCGNLTFLNGATFEIFCVSHEHWHFLISPKSG